MATRALREQDVEHTKQEQIENWISEAVASRQAYEQAGQMYAALCQRESELEAIRPCLHADVKKRLMDNEPSLAATPADKRVAIDSAYLKHLALQRDVVREKMDAQTRMVSAHLRTETALAAVRSIAGLL
jgi:hypothetical protein